MLKVHAKADERELDQYEPNPAREQEAAELPRATAALAVEECRHTCEKDEDRVHRNA